MDEKDFWKWIVMNLQNIPEFDTEDDNLPEIVNMFKEKFDFTRIKTSNAGKTIWNFSFSCITELPEELVEEPSGYWYNRPPHATVEIRIWKQKEKVRMGIISKLDHMSGKNFCYYNGNPRKFLEEASKRFYTNTTAKKFGL